MKYMTIKRKVKDIPKGAFTSVLWERQAKTKKSCTDIIKKRVRATVRIGVDYENLAVTKEYRTSTGKQSQGLMWGEWDVFPYFIKHTPKNGTETKYIRMYLGKGSNMNTEWYLNGRKVDKETIKPFILASELKDETIDNEKPVCVKVEDVLSIG